MDCKELIETKLEPEVAQVTYGGMEQAVAISTAISLKRIADAIEGNSQRYGLIDAILETRHVPLS